MSWCPHLFDQLRYLVLLSTISTLFFNLRSVRRTDTTKSTLNSNKISVKFPSNDSSEESKEPATVERIAVV